MAAPVKKVLVIDDDDGLRTTVSQVLRQQGYEPLEATGGEMGLELARTRQPDLILSDVQMEASDGYQVLSRLRAHAATATIPCVLMTGQIQMSGREEFRHSMELGADDFLVKPFSVATLMATVTAQLRKQQVRQEQAQEIRHRLVQILEATTDIVGITDARSDSLIYLNTAGRRLFGLAPQAELGRRPMAEYFPPWAAALLRGEAIRGAQRDGVWKGEAALLNPQGHEVPVSLVVVRHQAPSGDVDSFSIIARDITDSKRTEAALRRSEELFHIITQNATDLIAVVNARGQRLYNSPSYRRLLGFAPNEMEGTDAFEQMHPEDRDRVQELAKQSFATGCGQVAKYRMRHKDGSWRTFESHAAVIRNEGGEIDSLLVVARDITERERAERERRLMEVQLRHAQKLESIGQLAAGIAHEINTPTQYIGDNARFLQDAFADLSRLVRLYHGVLQAAQGGTLTAGLIAEAASATAAIEVDYLQTEIPKAISQTLQGVERVTRIVRAMKDFSHPGTEDKAMVDLNRAIESTLTVARNEWKYVADMVTDFAPDLPLVPCLPGEINQVVLNLVINAAHTIAEVVGDGTHGKGTITLRTRAEGDWVELRVEDTGKGIPENIRGRIFDPFFTTKPVGKGTGQGLAIAHNVVVEKHGGTIAFDTEVGKGTTFIIRLPRNPPAGDREKRVYDTRPVR